MKQRREFLDARSSWFCRQVFVQLRSSQCLSIGDSSWRTPVLNFTHACRRVVR